MSDPGIILGHCRRVGLRIWRDGADICIKPARACPPELLEAIREAKPQLLIVLAATDAVMTEQPPTATDASVAAMADLPGPEILRTWPTGKTASRPVQRGGTDAQWIYTSKQVLAGEFDGGDDRGRLESVLTGVRNIPHPDCQLAKARLETMLAKRKEPRP